MRKRNPKFGAPGKLRPAVFALKSPKASAPRLHQRNVGGRILLTGCLPKTQAAIRCGGSAPATPDSKEKPSRRRPAFAGAPATVCLRVPTFTGHLASVGLLGTAA